jgi:hypothetical protein
MDEPASAVMRAHGVTAGAGDAAYEPKRAEHRLLLGKHRRYVPLRKAPSTYGLITFDLCAS